VSSQVPHSVLRRHSAPNPYIWPQRPCPTRAGAYSS
jgi:hypothetical protein